MKRHKIIKCTGANVRDLIVVQEPGHVRCFGVMVISTLQTDRSMQKGRKTDDLKPPTKDLTVRSYKKNVKKAPSHSIKLIAITERQTL